MRLDAPAASVSCMRRSSRVRHRKAALIAAQRTPGPKSAPAYLDEMLRRHEAQEEIRRAQQGLGKSIISDVLNEHRIVAVGDTIYRSKQWKTFPDFQQLELLQQT